MNNDNDLQKRIELQFMYDAIHSTTKEERLHYIKLIKNDEKKLNIIMLISDEIEKAEIALTIESKEVIIKSLPYFYNQEIIEILKRCLYIKREERYLLLEEIKKLTNLHLEAQIAENEIHKARLDIKPFTK